MERLTSTKEWRETEEVGYALYLAEEQCKAYDERLSAIEDILGDHYDLDRLRELVKAQNEGRVVVLDMPRKPLVWGDDDHNSCICPDCSEDLMGIPYGRYMILQCPACGQYLDATKIITRAEAEAALGGGGDG